MKEGDKLQLVFDNPSSGESITQMCDQAGHELLEKKEEGGKIYYTIEKG
jgi:TusA-related sulfurtransferase